MYDLISRRVAKKKLEQNLTYMRAFGVDRCLELIDELPAVKSEPKWVPCSERLPETYGAYLVQDVCGGIFVDYWRGYWLAKTTMVAWRELPEPYKGVEQSEL